MKVKDLLWPIVLGVSALVMAISFFLPFAATEVNGNIMGESSAFFGLDGVDSPAFASIMTIAYIVGFIAVIVLATLGLVKAFGGKIANGKLIAIIAGIVAAVAAVAMVVFGILFLNANGDDVMKLIPQIGFYFAAAGLVIGAVSAFLTSKDLE